MTSTEFKNYLKDNPERIIEILEYVGCHSFRDYSTQIRCALPDSQNPTALRIDKTNLSAKIYSIEHKTTGDIFSVIEELRELDFKNALKLCHQILSLDFKVTKEKPKDDPLGFVRQIKRKNKYKRKFQNEELKTYREEELLSGFIKGSSIDFLKDNISADIQEEFNIHLSFETNRIIIPHYHWDDKTLLVGCNGRTLDKNWKAELIPKYFLTPFGYNKRHNLFGLSHNQEHIKKANMIIIVESEKAVMQLATMGYRCAVAIASHELTPEQSNIIKTKIDVEEIIIALDKDVTKEDVMKNVRQVMQFKRVYIIEDNWNLLGEKDSPTDKGKKVFEFLFKRKTLVTGGLV